MLWCVRYRRDRWLASNLDESESVGPRVRCRFAAARLRIATSLLTRWLVRWLVGCRSLHQHVVVLWRGIAGGVGDDLPVHLHAATAVHHLLPASLRASEGSCADRTRRCCQYLTRASHRRSKSTAW